jgi:hypothetical protein
MPILRVSDSTVLLSLSDNELRGMSMKKKWLPIYTLLLTSGICVGLGQTPATSSQQGTTVPASNVHVQVQQAQNSNDITTSGSASGSELSETHNSTSSADETAPFGSEACRPEEIDVTPCQ